MVWLATSNDALELVAVLVKDYQTNQEVWVEDDVSLNSGMVDWSVLSLICPLFFVVHSYVLLLFFFLFLFIDGLIGRE